eukprot:CAMPEP_0170462876 /NCGR_PEP_ID=MMETSP0123-20130129/8202_1 /TAXON_ID=182087 /ORGANISM="Favella ehrenbergii, Strain Fehren 1" /LENGTH=115 /DNA_ID=CAMNT_0010728175 /DNA_START=2246 /DNA_END=2593 /DNA_ORIENTATION=-
MFGHLFTELVRKLEDVFGRQAAQSDEVGLEVLVGGGDLVVGLQTTLLQDVVQSHSLRALLALSVEQEEALERVDVDLVGFSALLSIFEGLAKEQLSEHAVAVLKGSPSGRVEHFA